MESLKLNVSIVAYRTPSDELQQCLKALLRCGYVGRIEVIDNASEERIELICREINDPRVHYRRNKNVGFGPGHNIAMRETLEQGAEYHLVINADVDFAPGTLESCIEYLDSHPEVGLLIPSTYFPDGRWQSVCHPVPKISEMFLHRFTPWGWNSRRIARYELLKRDLSEPRNVPIIHGCFMLLRCSALREIGLFDERFFMYCEDFDLSRRMHARYKTIYYPHAKIVHNYFGGSKRSARLFRIHCVSMLKYFWKWGVVIDKERDTFNRRMFAEIPLKN